MTVFACVSSCPTFRHSLVTSHPASDSAFVTRPLPPLLLRLPHSSVPSSPSFFLHPTSMLHPLQHSENLTQRQIQFALARPSAGGIKSGKEEERRGDCCGDEACKRRPRLTAPTKKGLFTRRCVCNYSSLHSEQRGIHATVRSPSIM